MGVLADRLEPSRGEDRVGLVAGRKVSNLGRVHDPYRAQKSNLGTHFVEERYPLIQLQIDGSRITLKCQLIG